MPAALDAVDVLAATYIVDVPCVRPSRSREKGVRIRFCLLPRDAAGGVLSRCDSALPDRRPEQRA
jgi:hypothetical protein